MINAGNFCHIETVADGVKVLFFVEYDGDNAIIHQLTTLEIGTFDLKLTMPLERVEDLWPADIKFADAAANVIRTAKEMGFDVRPGSTPAPNKFDFQSRVAIAHGPLFDGDPTDVPERRDRNFEESCETAQAFDMTLDEALALVRYTWSRPPGDRIKELGSQILTAVSLAEVAGIGAMEAAEADLDKLQQPETIARIRAKRATRHGRGPLPGLDPSAQVTIIGFDLGTEQSQ
ncbi:hypothetical protein [Rhizobium sp. L51/94]|uniref:hypothetical protein n=1 Tax=Rhizobium sp. L51/94 TaxID=2819999 RepID=UPI001C5AD79E|nr:hypothetical protein [Rhizobium sp. L51/94]QXZ79616.1 hypothetical protein J5274_06430 [Rhizobium sp. L51/94]